MSSSQTITLVNSGTLEFFLKIANISSLIIVCTFNCKYVIILSDALHNLESSFNYFEPNREFFTFNQSGNFAPLGIVEHYI